VEKDGSVTNVKIMNDIGGGCGEEALRVVKMMPNWEFGEKRVRKTRTELTLPIRFTLED
ncbi:MAG: energy transducer TonB, partial [Bacteroidales bacterium]|nr:energy transducer TonB [Bacteroidales bacterium]